MPALPMSFNQDPIAPMYRPPIEPDDNMPSTYTVGPSTGNLTLTVRNVSKTWVEVVLDTDGYNWKSLKTGHFNPGESRTIVHPVQEFHGANVKITRWAPGAFNIPGNGGGDVTFIGPPDAQSIDIHLQIEAGG